MFARFHQDAQIEQVQDSLYFLVHLNYGTERHEFLEENEI